LIVLIANEGTETRIMTARFNDGSGRRFCVLGL
jgi:hypothetical protein